MFGIIILIAVIFGVWIGWTLRDVREIKVISEYELVKRIRERDNE